MKLFLIPFAIPYGMAVGVRNLLYNWKILKAVKTDSPVVAIGNVTVGGTGKTPVLLAIAEQLLAKKMEIAVVSRGYKRKTTGVLEVDSSGSKSAATQFGDEPTLIKLTLKNNVPVFVGERRAQAAKAVEASYGRRIILADDAFQHRALARNINVLLLDAYDDPRTYRLIPVGRARERLKPAINRADYIVLTKSNLVAPTTLQTRMDWLAGLTSKPIIKAEYTFGGFAMGAVTKSELKDKALLVSAVAKPESIEETIKGKVEIVQHQKFNDHHDFTDNEIEGILNESSRLGARWILCTEKDWVKLKRFSSLNDRLWVIKLKIQFSSEMKQLYEDISRLARS